MLSQPPLFTAHVSAWEGERKAGVRCSKGWGSHAMQMSHSLGVAVGTNLPAEPMETAPGSHTTAMRPQSREIMNTWGWCPPQTGPHEGLHGTPKRRSSISQGQSQSTCAKAARHWSCQECPGCSFQGCGGTAPVPPWGGRGGPVPLTATKLLSHKATGDPVPSVPDCHPLLRHGGWSSVSG